MKAIRERVTIIFNNNFESGEQNDIIKNIVDVNRTIEAVDNYSSLQISCEQAQMKTNKIIQLTEEKPSSEQQEGTSFLIFKN